jgi:hypothetical protein
LSTIKAIKTTDASSETTIDLDYSENQNFIQIIRGIETIESGYYLILGTYNDISERDVFLKELYSLGMININSFFHSKSGKYFIYHEKYDDLETAKTAVQSNTNMVLHGKMAIVKVEN